MRHVISFIFMCAMGMTAISWGSSNFVMGPGAIIEPGIDFYLYTKNMVMEIIMDAIFLTEGNFLSIKEELMFQENLEASGKKYFALNHTGPVSPVYDMAKQNYQRPILKLMNYGKWSIPHNIVEHRNSMLFAALSGLGVFSLLIGICLGIANLVQFRVELLEREQDLIVPQLNKQLQTLNKVVDELN